MTEENKEIIALAKLEGYEKGEDDAIKKVRDVIKGMNIITRKDFENKVDQKKYSHFRGQSMAFSAGNNQALQDILKQLK